MHHQDAGYVSESTVDLMCLLNGHYFQDFNYSLFHMYFIKSGVGSRNMQAINVLVTFSLDLLSVTLAGKRIFRKCFAPFNDNPLAFGGQSLNILQSPLADDYLKGYHGSSAKSPSSSIRSIS